MLIIDMPMPEFCIWRDDKNEPHRCPLLNEDDNCVPQDSNIWRGWNEQYAHCPIKGELPEEHGDLIDRDEMFEAINSRVALIDSCPEGKPSMKELFERDVLCVCLHDVVCAKAVIQAERKDDEQIH